MEPFIVISYAYLLGSIPFGFILTKIFVKKDIRKSGSGNIGASNVLRSGGKFLGLLTLLLDGAKGYFAILITLNNFQDYLILSASLTFMGHLFPIWLKFKGGKGVATYLGILIAINFILAIVFILTWIIIILISKYPSLASLVSTFIVLIVNFIFNGMYQSFILILFFLLILYSHKSNIQRLKAGTENKINL